MRRRSLIACAEVGNVADGPLSGSWLMAKRAPCVTQRRGRDLGTRLLVDAAARLARVDSASLAVAAGPKDDGAPRVYQHHGFIDMPHPEWRMFAPIESVS